MRVGSLWASAAMRGDLGVLVSAWCGSAGVDVSVLGDSGVFSMAVQLSLRLKVPGFASILLGCDV